MKTFNTKESFLLSLTALFISLINGPANCEERFLNDYQKLSFIAEQFVKSEDEDGLVSGVSPDIDALRMRRGALPCDVLEVKYYNSGPAWVVGAEHPIFGDEEFTREGIISSEDYKNGTFTEINRQDYLPGEKRYFIPAYFLDLDAESRGDGKTGAEKEAAIQEYKDFLDSKLESHPNGEFVGYISFRSMLVNEPYDPSKHKYVFLERENHRRRGDALVTPVKWTKTITDGYVPTGYGLVPTYKRVPYVTYEVCFDPQPVLRTENLVEGIYSKFNQGLSSGPRYVSFEDDIPTASMYRIFFNQLVERDLKHLDRIEAAAEVGVVILGSLHPATAAIVSVRNYAQCVEAGDSYCLAHALSENIGHLGGLLKIAKGAKTANKVVRAIGKIDQNLAEKALYFTAIAADTTLAILHAKNEGIRKSYGEFLGVSIEAAPLLFGGGKVIVGFLGKLKSDCITAVDDVNIKSVTSNLDDFTDANRDKLDLVETKLDNCLPDEQCLEIDASPLRSGPKPSMRVHRTQQEWFEYYNGMTDEILLKTIKKRFPNLPEPEVGSYTIPTYRASQDDPGMGKLKIAFTVTSGPHQGYWSFRFHTPSSKAAPGTGPVLRIERAVSSSQFRKGNFMELLDVPGPVVSTAAGTVDLGLDPDFFIDPVNGYVWVKNSRTNSMRHNDPEHPFSKFILENVHPEELFEDFYKAE